MKDILQFPLLALKTQVPSYGTIEGTMFTGGERFYWVRHPDGGIALLTDAFVRDRLKGAT